MAYKADLPAGFTLPPGHSIDTASSRYRDLEALATTQKWTQDAFSGLLGIEAKRVSSEYERARAAAPAPAPARPFSSLSTQEKFAAGLNNPPKRG